ncbi:hypothetical protein [Pseudomonas sp. PD9R]|uniref:hypothetical protein n=1 Tax=Pseudomonas sp. PD9R TaxID=2853534 RepID=UPI001C48823C|nr:hypothetical protein [Pseudomonas sp. PD9R]MBV6823851.1 hypothetical protein [Pseudomonas sp. PD9R]
MSRTLFDIAYASLDDLYELQGAFSEMNALFTLLAKNYPAGILANDIAQLGLARNEHWSSTVAQWTDCLDDELDGFPEQAHAYIAKNLRREALRAGGAQ